MASQEWSIISGVCTTPGAEGIPTYGVRVTYAEGTWEWVDVDIDPMLVRRLVERCNRVQPEPCHFADVVLDFIEEHAAGEL